MPKQWTQEEFVVHLRDRWGDRFDYSKTKYVNRKTDVIITCRLHGDQVVSPRSLLESVSSTGCPECTEGDGRVRVRRSNSNGGLPVNFSEFVRRARQKYGDRYEYVESSYQGISKKIRFICPEHGMQEQYCDNHLSSRSGNFGCTWCSKRVMGDRMRVPFSTFLIRAREVHGDLFGYSEERYFGLNNEVGIECQEHGVFWQSAKNHLDLGHGCSSCSGNKQHTTETWIAKARLVHGDRYSYEKSEYTTAHSPVIITCPRHGDFIQIAGEHTNKAYGCNKCGSLIRGTDNLHAFIRDSSRANEDCELYVALIKGFIKIGISKDSLQRDNLYEEFTYQRLTTRSVAWCVEQNVLHSTMWASPSALPRDLEEWSGKTELRNPGFISLEELSELIDQEVDKCENQGWQSYASTELLMNNLGSINLPS